VGDTITSPESQTPSHMLQGNGKRDVISKNEFYAESHTDFEYLILSCGCVWSVAQITQLSITFMYFLPRTHRNWHRDPINPCLRFSILTGVLSYYLSSMILCLVRLLQFDLCCNVNWFLELWGGCGWFPWAFYQVSWSFLCYLKSLGYAMPWQSCY
jgi:hypothetical protein